MKLPEPVGWQQVSTGQVWLFKANKDDMALFTESQLREARAQQEAVMRHVLELLGPQAPECCGCKAEWSEAIKALEDALN